MMPLLINVDHIELTSEWSCIIIWNAGRSIVIELLRIGVKSCWYWKQGWDVWQWCMLDVSLDAATDKSGDKECNDGAVSAASFVIKL